jgi:hypothetical protein
MRNRVDDQDRASRGADLLVPVVSAGQRILPAQHYFAGSGRPRWAEQQVPGRAEVVGIAVVPLAADPVIPMLAGVAPGILEVIHRGPHRRTARSAQGGCKLMPEARLARPGQAVNGNPERARAQRCHHLSHGRDQRRTLLRRRQRHRLPPRGH